MKPTCVSHPEEDAYMASWESLFYSWQKSPKLEAQVAAYLHANWDRTLSPQEIAQVTSGVAALPWSRELDMTIAETVKTQGPCCRTCLKDLFLRATIADDIQII
jgi:hypothetical protein